MLGDAPDLMYYKIDKKCVKSFKSTYNDNISLFPIF